MYIREEDAAPPVFDVLKLSKVSGVSGCVGKTVRPFVKLCAKTKSVSGVGKVSDIRKYFLQYINIKKYKHYTNVPATSYQLIHCENSVSCMEVRAHTSLDPESVPTVCVPGKASGMRTGEEEYVQPVRSQNF